MITRVPDSADIDDMSSSMQRFLKSVRIGEESFVLKTLSGPGLLPLEMCQAGDQGGACFTVVNIYDHLIETWLRPLSSAVPGRTRMAKERILRRVAITLYLAGVGVCTRADDSLPTSTIDRQAHQQLEHAALPIRLESNLTTRSNKGKERLLLPLSSPPPSSPLSVDAGFLGESKLKDREPRNPELFPTPAQTPSLHSQGSTSMSTAESEDPACIRLRQYTTLNTQPRLPPSMSKLLSHWDIGSDPADYNWLEVTRLTQDTSDMESLDDTSRKKSKARREHLLKRRHETKPQSASQPVPTVMWGSQPPSLAPKITSSQVVNDIGPMSQIERGAHGGRQGAKESKKRRAGF